jgi:hypothetical protein
MRPARSASAIAHLLIGFSVVCVVMANGGNQQLKELRDPGQSQGRPTRVGDPIPKFDMDYFVGEWRFRGTVPDSPLGTGGDITGTEVVRKAGDRPFYELTISGQSPDGPFDGKGVLACLDAPTGQYAVRYEVTRGIALSRSGALGGDLGGRYSQFWETPPFERNGVTIRLRGQSFSASPGMYRVQAQISVGGDVFQDFGTTVYEKQQ